MDSTATFVDNISKVIINPLLLLMFAIGLLVFILGVVEFLISMNLGLGGLFKKDDHGKSANSGKQHMLYGIIGMFVMISAYTIVKIIQNTFPAAPTATSQYDNQPFNNGNKQ